MLFLDESTTSGTLLENVLQKCVKHFKHGCCSCRHVENVMYLKFTSEQKGSIFSYSRQVERTEFGRYGQSQEGIWRVRGCCRWLGARLSEGASVSTLPFQWRKPFFMGEIPSWGDSRLGKEWPSCIVPPPPPTYGTPYPGTLTCLLLCLDFYRCPKTKLFRQTLKILGSGQPGGPWGVRQWEVLYLLVSSLGSVTTVL